MPKHLQTRYELIQNKITLTTNPKSSSKITNTLKQENPKQTKLEKIILTHSRHVDQWGNV